MTTDTTDRALTDLTNSLFPISRSCCLAKRCSLFLSVGSERKRSGRKQRRSLLERIWGHPTIRYLSIPFLLPKALSATCFANASTPSGRSRYGRRREANQER